MSADTPLVINAVWRFIYTAYMQHTHYVSLTIYLPIPPLATRSRLYNIYTSRVFSLSLRESVDIGTCYPGGFDPPFIVVLLPTDATRPTVRQSRWYGLTVTDDRCPESNTYIRWTGRQSIADPGSIYVTHSPGYILYGAYAYAPRAYYNAGNSTAADTPQNVTYVSFDDPGRTIHRG